MRYREISRNPAAVTAATGLLLGALTACGGNEHQQEPESSQVTQPPRQFEPRPEDELAEPQVGTEGLDFPIMSVDDRGKVVVDSSPSSGALDFEGFLDEGRTVQVVERMAEIDGDDSNGNDYTAATLVVVFENLDVSKGYACRPVEFAQGTGLSVGTLGPRLSPPVCSDIMRIIQESGVLSGEPQPLLPAEDGVYRA